MKALLLLLLFSINLMAHSKIDSFTLPEDSHHFIYFIQKIFSKRDQNISIISTHFSMPQLISKMAKNRSSNFEIFISKSAIHSKSIHKLALYKHIKISICKGIQKTFIFSEDIKLKFDLPLIETILKEKRASISSVQAKKNETHRLSHCQGY